ncbi:MAG: carboxylating nicotinate-nucleotide diphosphorylase [Pseudomonadales bacterium]|nr:carboxylating nicotinate-nucleotide diphosphorylase [Pseudomonadales bacterium]MBO6564816.1 carboxylating nicotinate-nucleotide diphosphorylase [Pseudomonadales bacterium]MBO6594279.1 carboxylating nicotinate-nucleotide diphosphorylase [Pseudomonadales bacterium]MBO6658609.1 carboxylating nicotinate-nucleotide diphosphorylase [Pseudomonadales bacterium]MBO6700780.1 carboxylating nicotinate-nucleotide diphosphorylase [Pseudomonadales bacterium]
MDYFEGLAATVAAAIAEDVGSGDLTASLVHPHKIARATVITRSHAIICGRPWVDEVIRQVDPSMNIDWRTQEGASASPGDTLFSLEGKAQSLLTAERTALNFLQLLSGTATRTSEYVKLVSGSNVTLLDTRKTIPGLRLAQKYAVKTGGAENHRIGLFDAFLIKENHIEAAGSITGAIKAARDINGEVRVEVEVENFDQLEEAINAKPDWVMLDNFTPDDMARAVKIAEDSGIKLEASGGIESPEELKKIAATGVDYISIGALTKHNEAVDLSMRIE